MEQTTFNAARADEGSDDEQEVDLRNVHCLIIDDQAQTRTTLRGIVLRLEVGRCDVAESFQEGINRVKLASHPYDVVLSDYSLGNNRNGQQFLEAIRRRKLLPASSVFIMITGENSYREVMAAAELLPDDYLIKPFTSETLRRRLTRAIRRKGVLTPVLMAMDQGQYREAIDRARESRALWPKYGMELARLEAECLQASGQHQAVIDICNAILEKRFLPWARLLKGKALLCLGQYDEASEEIKDLLTESPHYMTAYDVKACILSEQGHHREAQRVLEFALAKNPKGMSRCRLHGRLAARHNEFDAAERSFSMLLQQGADTGYLEADDYVQCALANVRLGRTAKADEIMNRARDALPLDPNVPAHEALVKMVALGPSGKDTTSNAAWANLKNSLEAAHLSPDLKLEVMRTAFKRGDDVLGKQLGVELAFQRQGDEAALKEVMDVFEAFQFADEGAAAIAQARREMIELNNRAVMLGRAGKLKESVELLIGVAKKPSAPPMVLFNTVSAIITLQHSPEKDRRFLETAKKLLQRAESLDMANPKVEIFRTQLASLG